MKDSTILKKAADIVRSRGKLHSMNGVADQLDNLAIHLKALDKLKKDRKIFYFKVDNGN